MISPPRFGVFTIEFDRRLLTQKLSLIGEEVYTILTEDQSFLQPGSTITPDHAAARIHKLYWGGSDADTQRRISIRRGYIPLVTELWILILDIVQQLPQNYDGGLAHKGMVKMVEAMKELEYADADGVLRLAWDDLPMFRVTICDEIPTKHLFFDPTSEEGVRLTRMAHNYQTFVACITGQGISDFSLWGLWALRDALEYVPDHDLDSTVFRSQGWRQDIYVPLAAIWIKCAGRMLYRRVLCRGHEEWEGNLAKGGNLWEGRRGFCRERWALWKRRFGEIAGFEQPAKVTRELARKAKEMMEVIEGGPPGLSLGSRGGSEERRRVGSRGS